jgi:hypothetical protein
MVTIIPGEQRFIPVIVNLGKLQELGAKLRLSLAEITSIRYSLDRLNVHYELCRWSFRTLLMHKTPLFKWLLQLIPALVKTGNADAAKLLVFTWFMVLGDPNKFAKMLDGMNFNTTDRWQKLQLPEEILA